MRASYSSRSSRVTAHTTLAAPSDNPATGDARISGSAASLCGIESALAAGDPGELTLAIRRLESMYAVVFHSYITCWDSAGPRPAENAARSGR